jgi:hypothetical protein
MNIKALILVFAALVIGLSSCQKNGGDLIAVAQTTGLNVINASADTLNFYQNGTRLNNTSNLYPGGSLGYQAVTYGAQNYQFKKAGNANALVTIPLALDVSRLYTLFVAGETADKLFLLRDTLITDTGKVGTTSSRIRFVNASSAGNLDVYIGSSFHYSNRAFKSNTGFIRVTSGPNVLTIYQSGSTTPLLPPGTLTLAAGTSYTLFTKGTLNGTGNNAFAARILTVQ